MAKLSRLELLSPQPITWNGIKIYKPTLREIGELGFEEYNRYTGLITLSDIEIHDFYAQQQVFNADIEPFNFLISSCQNKLFFLELQLAFFTYLRKSVKVSIDGFIIPDEELGDKIITRENFTEFQNIIRQITMTYDDIDEDDIITDDLRMKEKFMQKRKMLKEAKRKQREKQRDNGKEITLVDVISALCVFGVGYNLMNVWDLTIYQLYDQFSRCQKKELYEHNTDALLAGADKKKIDLRYWIRN